MPQDMTFTKTGPKAKAGRPKQSIHEAAPVNPPACDKRAANPRHAWLFDVRIAESQRANYARSLTKVKDVVQSAAYVAEGLRAVTEVMRGEDQIAVVNATSWMLSEMLRGYLADDLVRIERLERLIEEAPEAHEADQVQWDGVGYFDPRDRSAL